MANSNFTSQEFTSLSRQQNAAGLSWLCIGCCLFFGFPSVWTLREQTAECCEPFIACQRTVIRVAVKDNRNKHTRSPFTLYNVYSPWPHELFHTWGRRCTMYNVHEGDHLVWFQVKLKRYIFCEIKIVSFVKSKPYIS